MTINNAHSAECIAVMGAPESGKSTTINLRLAADDCGRRLIFDPGEDYSKCGTVTDKERDVARIVVAAGAGPFSVVFRPSFDLELARLQFSRFCALAHAAGNLLVVADELEDFVLPGWSPPGWRALVGRGRKRGCRVIAASRRPAGIDKAFWSLATVIRSGRLNFEDDAATVARALIVTPRDVMLLPPLHFIQRSVSKPVVMWGRIDWTRGGPQETVLQEKNILSAAGSGPTV